MAKFYGWRVVAAAFVLAFFGWGLGFYGPPVFHADRRIVASLSFAVQSAGALVLIAAAGSHVPLLLAGVLLFGVGIGNVTSMPPLIAQVEFVKDDVPRVVALTVAVGQATYAFAPAGFGLIRELAGPNGGGALLAAAALTYALAIGTLLIGRGRRSMLPQS